MKQKKGCTGTLIKCYNTLEGFQEIPGEVSLLLNISNCQNKCPGCHTPILQEDVGEVVNGELLDYWLSQGPFTCVCLMGEGNDVAALITLIMEIEQRGYKTAVYSGSDASVGEWIETYQVVPNFLKLGSYQEEFGPLKQNTTNQRLYELRIQEENLFSRDITEKFWRKKD